MERILLVDDEDAIREMIKEYMGEGLFEVDEAANGFDALIKLKKHTYDLIVLDVMMPKMDGWTVCREVRKESDVPIIMLTARGEEYDKLFGFELGVDDYLVKPFSPKELIARIKAILGRNQKKNGPQSKPNRFTKELFNVDFDSKSVKLGEELLNFTPKEYELLAFLINNPNRAFSREQLLEAVWGFDFYGDDRTVDSHIKMIREKIGPYRKWIHTVWGLGYKFDAEVK